jgi:hypothetical protein
MNPQDSHAGNQPQARPPVIKTGLPGWIASAALHLLLVLLLAYTWSGPASVSIPTKDRSVAIVLATRNDNEGAVRGANSRRNQPTRLPIVAPMMKVTSIPPQRCAKFSPAPEIVWLWPLIRRWLDGAASASASR